jgi:hypothetical protein
MPRSSYFWSKTSKTTYDDDLDELKGLETPLPTSELTLEPTKPTELTIPPSVKRGRGRSRKNPITESYLTSVDAPAKELPPIDILVLI